MSREHLRYDEMIEEALRGVVRSALAGAAKHGLPGRHHFYLTFRTDDAGVVMPDHLRSTHSQEMTIVLEHQFWGLEVDEEAFSVALSFNGVRERLVVPFTSITAFLDPSVHFELRFPVRKKLERRGKSHLPSVPISAREDTGAAHKGEERATRKSAGGAGESSGKARERDAKSGEVIAFDAFRKK